MNAALTLHTQLSLRLDAVEAYRLAHAYRDEELQKFADRLASRASLYGDSRTVNEVIRDLRQKAGAKDTAPAPGPEPSAPEQSEYIVQCVRTAGSMYEKDARAFLAEHDAHVHATALREAADLAEQRTGGPEAQHVLLDFATQLRRAANAREIDVTEGGSRG